MDEMLYYYFDDTLVGGGIVKLLCFFQNEKLIYKPENISIWREAKKNCCFVWEAGFGGV
jgi:hypothetical protein